MRTIENVNPQTHSYHYSNPMSQNALICETHGFPCEYDENLHTLTSAYSDRIQGWDSKRFSDACEIVGTGDQGWAHALPRLTEAALKKFAMVALNLEATPIHVRAIHCFNVSTGYSCPVIQAIYLNS